jgi:hypothetical protein
MKISYMLAMMMSAQNIPRIPVSYLLGTPDNCTDSRLGVKEVVTLTSDLSRKNLEKDFERMDTPQGTFYRVYFDIYLTLDGSEFNAELVCQGEVMGRCTSRFK